MYRSPTGPGAGYGASRAAAAGVSRRRCPSPYGAYRAVVGRYSHAVDVGQVDRLTRTGRAARLGGTLVVVALLLAGTLFGQDDAFPFGPFRMFSTRDALDAPVADTRVDGFDAHGDLVPLTEHNTGIRRAEIEGQLGRFRSDPALLHVVADAYHAHNPSAPPITRIEIVVRWHALHDGRPTGEYRDETVTSWPGGGATCCGS